MREQMPPAMGFLISRYPAVSHTFILREVLALRACGLRIETASINAPDLPPATMPPEESAETRATYYVKQHGVPGALAAHSWAVVRQPAGWWRGLKLAVRLGRGDVRSVLRGLAYFTEALMIGRWMSRRGLRHLHVHFATAAANVGLYVKAVCGVSLSITVHGPDEFDNVEAQCLPQKFAAADFLFCIGRYARSQVMRLSAPADWHKLEIAPLGVDVAEFAPRGERGPGPFHVVCVGRLTPAKGQRVLLEAARQMQAAGREFVITFAGAGPDEAQLKTATTAWGLDARVRFAGALNRPAVRALYASADALVLPSFAEGIPVVLMEAMASGIPCVSTRITGIPELIRSDAEGLLVAPADEVALAQAITRLMDDPALCGQIARAARARVESDYHLGRNVTHLAALFAQRLGVAA